MLRIYKRFFLIKIFQPARVSENICPNRDCSPAADGVNVWNLMGGIERLSWGDKKFWEFEGNFPCVRPAIVVKNISKHRYCCDNYYRNEFSRMVHKKSWQPRTTSEILTVFIYLRLFLWKDFLCLKKISISLNQNINPPAAWEFRLLNGSCICWLGFVGRFEPCFPALYSNLFSSQNYWKYLSLQILLPLVKFTLPSQLALLLWQLISCENKR